MNIWLVSIEEYWHEVLNYLQFALFIHLVVEVIIKHVIVGTQVDDKWRIFERKSKKFNKPLLVVQRTNDDYYTNASIWKTKQNYLLMALNDQYLDMHFFAMYIYSCIFTWTAFTFNCHLPLLPLLATYP